MHSVVNRQTNKKKNSMVQQSVICENDYMRTMSVIEIL